VLNVHTVFQSARYFSETGLMSCRVRVQRRNRGSELICHWHAFDLARKATIEEKWSCLMCADTDEAGIVELTALNRGAAITQQILRLRLDACKGTAMQAETPRFGMCELRGGTAVG